MKFKKLPVLKTTFATTVSIIGLILLLPQTALADVCNNYWSCAECMTTGQSNNCIWVQNVDVCMNKDELKGYPTGDYYRTCAPKAPSQPTPTTPTSRTPIPTPTTKKEKEQKGPVCGDNKCETGESYKNCSKDCKKPTDLGKGCKQLRDCYDGYCINGICQGWICGNAYCEDIEDCATCPRDCGKCTKPMTSISLCGNGLCDTHRGETCKNCEKDCTVQDFCCVSDIYGYVLPFEVHKNIYNIHEAQGNLIPDGTIPVKLDYSETELFSRSFTFICKDGERVQGDCNYDIDCNKGGCFHNYCVLNLSKGEEPTLIENPGPERAAYDIQQGYKAARIQTYTKHGNKIISHEDAVGLEIKLDVQGYTVDNTPEVSVGDEIELRMNVKNVSDNKIAIIAGISFEEFGPQVKVLKRSSGYSRNNIFAGFVGTFLNKVSGSKYYILTPGAEYDVYLKVEPMVKGTLKPEGWILAVSELKFVENAEPGLVKSSYTKEEFQEAQKEVTLKRTIKVKEKPPCNWWPLCL